MRVKSSKYRAVRTLTTYILKCQLLRTIRDVYITPGWEHQVLAREANLWNYLNAPLYGQWKVPGAVHEPLLSHHELGRGACDRTTSHERMKVGASFGSIVENLAIAASNIEQRRLRTNMHSKAMPSLQSHLTTSKLIKV